MTNHPNRNSCMARLCNAGIQYDDAVALRRISMTLQRWHELECGDSNNPGDPESPFSEE